MDVAEPGDRVAGEVGVQGRVLDQGGGDGAGADRQALLKAQGLEAAWAARIEVSGATWSMAKSGARPIGDKLARQIEQHCGKSAGWLDEERRQFCWSHLQRDFQAIRERAGEAGEIGAALLAATKDLFPEWHRYRAGELDRRAWQTVMEPMQALIAECSLSTRTTLPFANCKPGAPALAGAFDAHLTGADVREMAGKSFVDVFSEDIYGAEAAAIAPTGGSDARQSTAFERSASSR